MPLQISGNQENVNSVHKKKSLFVNQRLKLVRNFAWVLLAIISLRLGYLYFFLENSEELKNLSKQQYHRLDQLNAFRGVIFDRRDTPLALSITRPSVAINPRVFAPSASKLKKLVHLLGISEKKINTLATKNTYFAWLKRQISFETADKIKQLRIEGLHFILEPHRFYPQNNIAAPLIGFVGIDHKGLLGIEYFFDSDLRPPHSNIQRAKDAKGRPLITSSGEILPEMIGKNIYLTIDLVIQEIAEEALAKWVKNAQAKSGFAIISDPHSGKLLAIANHPSFNPNMRKTIHQEKTRNLAFTYLFEPGSVIKPFIIALALENKASTYYKIHNCEKSGAFKVDKNLYIHDDHPKEFLTTEEILIHSSNICTYKLSQSIGKKTVHDGLKMFGFSPHEKSEHLMGTQSGSLQPWQNWTPVRFANISFGQGFLASGLEIVTAYNVLANGGFYTAPKIIEKITSSNDEVIFRLIPQNKQIISAETARLLRQALAEVVKQGTGKNAQLLSYTSAGKTGTAEKFDNELLRYSQTKRIASFAGFAPAKDPHITIYVVIDEPSVKPYYGGTWAAPAFAEIAEKSLRYLNVPPEHGMKKDQEEMNVLQISKLETHGKRTVDFLR